MIGGSQERSSSPNGPPRQGTRTRSGSDGSQREFTYDESGHLILDSGQARPITYTWDGDLLTSREWVGLLTYEYDSVGNLLRKRYADETGASNGTMEFDYACWL